MKADRQLQNEVIEQLGFDPRVSAEKIGVTADKGVVTLTGMVPSYAEKYAAEKTTCRIEGVKSVVEEIEVELPGTHMRSDYDIAEAAANALQWDVFVPSSVKATVEGGEVKLVGEVEWAYQRDSALTVIRRLTGINKVANLITIKSKAKVKPSEIKESIERVLTRAARDEALHIKVDVKEDKVILNGKVRSFEESEDARSKARGAFYLKDEV